MYSSNYSGKNKDVFLCKTNHLCVRTAFVSTKDGFPIASKTSIMHEDGQRYETGPLISSHGILNGARVLALCI